MPIYNQDNVKLQEAMTMGGLTQIVRIWFTSGLHVEYGDIPQGANALATGVMKSSNGKILIAVKWNGKEDTSICVSGVAEVSDLEELQERFPHLFELEGTFYAFP